MNEVTYYERIDAKKHGVQFEINAYQNDSNVRKIIISLTDGSASLNLENAQAQLYCTKPDGNVVYEACEINSNTVSVILSQQALCVPGIVSCQLRIVEVDNDLNKQILYCPEFEVVLNENYYDDNALESTNEYSEMVQATADVLMAKRDAIEATNGAIAAANNANQTAEIILNAKNNGEFQGVPGAKGEQGEQGPKGDKGDKGDKGEHGETGPPGTTTYTDLTDKPSINGVTLEGDMSINVDYAAGDGISIADRTISVDDTVVKSDRLPYRIIDMSPYNSMNNRFKIDEQEDGIYILNGSGWIGSSQGTRITQRYCSLQLTGEKSIAIYSNNILIIISNAIYQIYLDEPVSSNYQWADQWMPINPHLSEYLKESDISGYLYEYGSVFLLTSDAQAESLIQSIFESWEYYTPVLLIAGYDATESLGLREGEGYYLFDDGSNNSNNAIVIPYIPMTEELAEQIESNTNSLTTKGKWVDVNHSTYQRGTDRVVQINEAGVSNVRLAITNSSVGNDRILKVKCLNLNASILKSQCAELFSDDVASAKFDVIIERAPSCTYATINVITDLGSKQFNFFDIDVNEDNGTSIRTVELSYSTNAIQVYKR